MQVVFSMIRRVAPTNACVLITGESGSGKELVARAIHSLSNRSAAPFLAINCAAMPEALFESEVFGHEKGAFTGAHDRRAGALAQAHGGTLFLDEIAEMPVAVQAKTLRVLEDFRFRRLGGKTELTADIRLISATNREPEAAIRDGKMRQDLYYRLNVFHIKLPPLRDRVEDVPLIAEAMVEKLNLRHGTRITHVEPDAMLALQAHRWDGNVRELRNTIERAAILAGEGPLSKAHFQSVLQRRPDSFTTGGNCLGVRIGMTVADTERVLIEATLAHARNNKTQAANTLGISTKTLHAKLKQYRPEERHTGENPTSRDVPFGYHGGRAATTVGRRTGELVGRYAAEPVGRCAENHAGGSATERVVN
jgi:DNA-binding NtrC family response regulator